MNDDRERIENARRIVDFFGSPSTVILLYFAGAILLSIMGVQDTAPWAFMALFLILFAVYMVSANIRRALMTKEQRDAEDKYDDWLSGQRGP